MNRPASNTPKISMKRIRRMTAASTIAVPFSEVFDAGLIRMVMGSAPQARVRLVELGGDVREDANHGAGDAGSGGHHSDRNQDEHHCILNCRDAFLLTFLVHVDCFFDFHFYSPP